MKASWTYKITLLGSSETGKSSFIKKNQNVPKEKDFDDYSKLIGTNFFIKRINVHPDKLCQLQLWDLHISENFFSVLPSFFRGSSAFLLFFDTSNHQTFSDLDTWIDIIHTYSEDVPIFLVGTKTDLKPDISLREILGFVQEHGIYGPFFTSIEKESGNEIIFSHIINVLIGIPISSKDHENLMEMQFNYDRTFICPVNRADSYQNDGSPQENLLLLKDIAESSFTTPKFLKRNPSPEEKKVLEKFLELFKYCPVCHQANHEKYLKDFFFSNDPVKRRIKAYVLDLIEMSEDKWERRMFYNNITIGIPCCNCFNKFFKN
ncbi:MAG: GTP-binding protein [Promethearchaeota archaeon]|nr:MAG: GTP-binding protein [Candidatus Lokiarchaeota archaeon]